MGAGAFNACGAGWATCVDGMGGAAAADAGVVRGGCGGGGIGAANGDAANGDAANGCAGACGTDGANGKMVGGFGAWPFPGTVTGACFLGVGVSESFEESDTGDMRPAPGMTTFGLSNFGLAALELGAESGSCLCGAASSRFDCDILAAEILLIVLST